MRGMLVRALIALVCWFVFWLIAPLFMQVVGFPMTGQVLQLVKLISACLAVLYVLFGPPVPAFWNRPPSA